MNAKERSAAWAVDQQDPDNWLKIPDFGINPKDVTFNGFAFPIVTPGPKGHELMRIVREHVKTARALIRKENRSLSEVKADFIAVLDMMEEKPEAEKLEPSICQTMATFYIATMQSAESAVWHGTIGTPKSLELCYRAISQCAEGVRNLMLLSLKGKKDFDVAITEAIARHSDSKRKSLSEAGKRGASVKHQSIRALKEWALEKANGMRGSDRDIARKLSTELPVHLAEVSNDSMRLIYDTLRAKKNSD